MTKHLRAIAAILLLLIISGVPAHTQDTLDRMIGWAKNRITPDTPSAPSPADQATGVTAPVTLSWTSFGADRYDVRFGTTTRPIVVARDITATSFGVTTSNGVKYYWQITAKNSAGTRTSPLWSFTPGTGAPPPPSEPPPSEPPPTPPPPSSGGTTYYVSTLGNDSNSCATATSTTQGNQKLTISAGVACANAGDVVLIHGGTYTGAINTIDSNAYTVRSGTNWSAPITVSGVPSEIVTIRPPLGRSCVGYSTVVAYTIVQDVICDMVNNAGVSGSGGGADGVYVGYGANHNRFLRVEVKNGGANGYQFSDANGNSAFNEVLYSKIHDNGQAPGENNGYGLYIGTSDNLFEGNDVYQNGGFGFHLYDNEGPFNVARNTVRRNRIHHNGTHGGTNYGIVVAWGADNRVENNLIYANRGGVLAYTNSTNLGVYNNTIANNTPLEGIKMEYYGNAPTIRNNIVYGNAAGIVNAGGTGTPVLDHNVTANPMFANAVGFDFSLSLGSPAIDTGVAVSGVTVDFAGTARPQGSGYDVGAYER